MKSLIKILLQCLSRLIPFRIYPKLIRRKFLSIFYHAVSDLEMEHVKHLYPVVPEAVFISSVNYLKNYHTFITYDQLHDHVLDGAPLPPNAVHLSFDDGFAECFSIVRPLLIDKGIPCTFFLTLDWLDNHSLFYRHLISLCVHNARKLHSTEQLEFITWLNDHLTLPVSGLGEYEHWITGIREPSNASIGEVSCYLNIDTDLFLKNRKPYLTKEQVLQMHADGFTIGSHGLSHRKLGLLLEQEIVREIVESCQEIQDITGQQVVPFSFPQSAGNVNRLQLENLRAHHPKIGLLFDTKDLRVDKFFLVNRIWAERPNKSDRKLLSIKTILSNAYQDAWVDGVINSLA